MNNIRPIWLIVGSVLLTLAVVWGVNRLVHPIPAPAPPAPISLDANYPGHVGRMVVIQATTAGTLVKWTILGGPTPDNFDLVVEDAKTVYFCTPVSGDYRLEAITVVGGEAQRTETHLLIDVGPTPPVPPIPPVPPVPPVPPPPIPAGQLRVLLTYDGDVPVSSGQLAVLKEAATQKLVPTGNWRVFEKSQPFGDELPVWKQVFDKRKNPVGIVLFNGNDGSVAYEGPLPGSMADAAALIKKYGG